MTTHFQIIFRGQALSGFTVEQLKINVAKLYNTDVSNIESLFSGSPVVIKDDLDETTALKYADVFRKQGALCEVRDKSVATSNSVSSVADKQNSKDERPLEKTDTQAVYKESLDASAEIKQVQASQKISAAAKCTVVLDDYVGSMAKISIAESGSTMVEYQPHEKLDINIDKLEIAQAGETLVEFKKVEEPQISIDEFSLAPTGTDLND